MKELLKNRRGMTLAETMAALAVFAILMTLLLGCLRSASRVQIRGEQQTRAALLLDATLETVCTEVENACGTLRLYEDGEWVEEGLCGPAAAYETARGEEALLYLGRDGTLICRTGDKEETLHPLMYQGLTLEISFAVVDETTVEITAKALSRSDAVAQGSIQAQLRHIELPFP